MTKTAQLTKNKLTDKDILDTISTEQYHHFPMTTVTICALTLKNGFVVVGKSACVDPANFNADVGKSYAKMDAVKQIWDLEGYLLKEHMYHSQEFDKLDTDSQLQQKSE